LYSVWGFRYCDALFSAKLQQNLVGWVEACVNPAFTDNEELGFVPQPSLQTSEVQQTATRSGMKLHLTDSAQQKP
jgi:hypothetical protein